MSEQSKPMNLLQRLNAVRTKVDYIQKDKSVSTGQSGSYKAVTHDMVTAMTREHLIEFGVIFFPSIVASKMTAPLQLDPAKPNRQWLYEATYDFEFCNIDDPADTKTVRIEAHANDNADKAPGKALSYAAKYAILKVLNIETGEDEEGRIKEEFDITPHIGAIKACTTLETLKEVFEIADKAAKAAGDKGAVNAIAGAKNARGVEIQKSIPMTDEKFAANLEKVKAGKAPLSAFDAYTLTEKQKSIVADLKATQK